MTRRESTRRSLRSVVRFSSAMLLVAVLIWYVDWRQFVRSWHDTHLGWTVGVCLAALGTRLVRAIKWNRLLRCRGIQVSDTHAFGMVLAGHFLGYWTPGGLGGDAYRVAALRTHRDTPFVISTILLERIFGLAVLAGLTLAMLPWTASLLPRGHGWVPVMVVTVLSVGCGLVYLLRRHLATRSAAEPSRWRGPIDRLLRALAHFADHPRTLVQFGWMTWVEVLLLMAINGMAMRAAGANVPWWVVLGTMPLVHLLLRLPISFQGIGLQELSFATVLQLAGYAPAVGVTVSLLQRMVELISSLIPGAIALLLLPKISAPPTKGSPSAKIELPLEPTGQAAAANPIRVV